MKVIPQDPAPPTGILPEEEYQKLLSAMRLEYGRLLPDKLTELSTEWDLLVQEWEPERRTRFIRLAHSLAGSAGSYGFPCVSENARTLELFAKATFGDMPPTTKEIDTVTALVDKLKLGFDETVQAIPACVGGGNENEQETASGAV